MSTNSARQRFATYLTFIMTSVALSGGLLLRLNIEGSSIPFLDRRAGVSVRFPVNWLLERGTADSQFIMRVEDPAALPFKTSMSIATIRTGPDATINDLTELLNIGRAGQLSSYKTLDITPLAVAGRAATQITYAYATTETNPSLRSIPVIVRGIDVIIVGRGQAYVFTFLSESTTFDRNQQFFDRFLSQLEFTN